MAGFIYPGPDDGSFRVCLLPSPYQLSEQSENARRGSRRQIDELEHLISAGGKGIGNSYGLSQIGRCLFIFRDHLQGLLVGIGSARGRDQLAQGEANIGVNLAVEPDAQGVSKYLFEEAVSAIF